MARHRCRVGPAPARGVAGGVLRRGVGRWKGVMAAVHSRERSVDPSVLARQNAVLTAMAFAAELSRREGRMVSLAELTG